MIAEYRDIKPEQFSVHTVLDKRTKGNREYRLEHAAAGYEPAGACARMREVECWSVLFYLDGATHGRSFLSETQARDLFNAWTV